MGLLVEMRDAGHTLAYLVRRTGAAPSRVSNHQRFMEEAGVIRTRQGSGGRIYSLKKEGLQQVQTFLEGLLKPNGTSGTTAGRRPRRK
jgi:hypothetical protein